MVRGGIVVGPRYVVRTLEVCLFLALACSFAAALESDRTIAQFAHTAWGPKDGAPSVVTALAQSADGYLWLGSPDGLYRFDGVVFELYQPQSGGPFSDRNVSSLLALPNGDLWIGFTYGICLLRNGHATNYTSRDGVPSGGVWGLAQDREGVTWAASGSGLARLEDNRWKEVGKDWNFPEGPAHTIFLDRQGTLWVSTENTLLFLPAGARRFQLTGIRVGEVSRIAQAASGKLWMAETSRSVRPIPLSDKRQPLDDAEVQVGSGGMLFDDDGALWITSIGDGLRRAPAPELLRGKIKEFSTAIESFTARDGLSDDYVRVILQDREGNIWVGTNNGLDRFRKTNLVPVVLPFKPGNAVLAAGDAGDLWVENVRFKFRLHRARADRGGDLIPGGALSAYSDSAGAIWWLCDDAIYRYYGGSYTKVALPSSFPKLYTERAIAATEDGSGALWLAAVREGLFYRKKGRWQRLESASEFAKLSPRTAFTDWMGRAWFAYVGGTIILVKDEKIQKVFRPSDSPVGTPRAITGRGRHTWVGGDLGLAFFDGNRFRRIIPADAEAFGVVMGVEETPDGSLWLAESRGVIRVPASDVQQALDHPFHRVKYRIFDSFDGLQGTIMGVGPYLREVQGTDGGLWFVASGGIVWVDPANISTNQLPPPVSIRSVKVNSKQLDSLTNLVLPPRTTDLQIGYTALSLAVPEKVRFRYRLEGVDKDWQEASTRREAFYTRLGPGEYHFRVIASNNDGVWNEEGARLDIGIAPAWFQATWFYILCTVAFLALLWAVYQLRLHQLRQQFNIKLEERVGERTRIARELHDTLLQSFHGLMFQFQAARNLLPRRPNSAMQALDEAILETEQAIAEGRDAIRDLRPEPAAQRDLAELLTAVGKELEDGHPANGHSPGLRVIVEGKPQRLSPTLQDEIYRIGREVIRNAFHHAAASRIEAEIRYDEHQLRLRIRDDGKGIDPKVLEAGGSPGHWGLPGIRERAERIGSQFEFWSEAGAGTEVELRVPAAFAYEKRGDGNRFRLFHRGGKNGERS